MHYEAAAKSLLRLRDFRLESKHREQNDILNIEKPDRSGVVHVALPHQRRPVAAKSRLAAGARHHVLIKVIIAENDVVY